MIFPLLTGKVSMRLIAFKTKIFTT